MAPDELAAASARAPGELLREAAARGDAPAATRLLAGLRRVRFSRDPAGRSALHVAAGAGSAAVARVLAGAAAPHELDAPDAAGCAPLQRAAADGHEDVVRVLLQAGADADRRDGAHGNSALHEAAWKGYSRTVRALAAAGAALDQANAGGFTPLHLCCQNGHNQCCRELLLAGCDPDAKNNYGDTSLHTAARYGHAGVTRILISARCKVSEQNKNGDTALHIAAAMGRRKLARILLEAGCSRALRNQQGETARDIARRKDLREVVDILDDAGRGKREKREKRRGKSRVRFEGKPAAAPPAVGNPAGKETTDGTSGPERSRHWSPYGCHYYPDPEAFPSPRLDSLPAEPLSRGEQYYLDLAGNICKGPVGVGYTCYCAPLFRHLEARIERDKRELQRAQVRLGQRVAGLEQKLSRGVQGRRSERVIPTMKDPVESQLPRSRSLEMLDKVDKAPLQATRSMDELDPPDPSIPRPTVKEMVARIQQHSASHNTGNHSESSDDEDAPLRMAPLKGPMGDSNLAQVQVHMPSYENIPADAPARSRVGMYSPTVNTALIDSTTRYIEPVVKIQESSIRYNETYTKYAQQAAGPSTRYQPELRYEPSGYGQPRYEASPPGAQRYDTTGVLSARLAQLRVIGDAHETRDPIEGSSRVLDASYGHAPHTDTADRDTNNDSGYSTKVYGSSKGNSPSLSGQIEGECLGASSVV